MLAEVIPAYLYQEYQPANDDGSDDVTPFFDAFNGAAQYYVSWFATVGLPYYPGLSGPLLDWVVEGLYGLTRTSLESQLSAAFGAYNTVAYNTTAYNGSTPASQTYYTLTYDMFQRILTWDFYKADGFRFTPTWLKRRVMRFILGVNGIDPNPFYPGFQVGCENTQAIGVTFSGSTCIVTISESILSQYATLTPGILQVFQAAFEGQALELPLQYTYSCVIVAPMIATATPRSLVSSGTASGQVTGTTTISVIAGSGSFTYAWTFLAGSSPFITCNSPTAVTTAFTLTGGTIGNTYTAIALCTITDTVTLATTTVVVSISCTCLAIEILTDVAGAAGGALIVDVNGNPGGFLLQG